MLPPFAATVGMVAKIWMQFPLVYGYSQLHVKLDTQNFYNSWDIHVQTDSRHSSKLYLRSKLVYPTCIDWWGIKTHDSHSYSIFPPTQLLFELTYLTIPHFISSNIMQHFQMSCAATHFEILLPALQCVCPSSPWHPSCPSCCLVHLCSFSLKFILSLSS